MKSLPAEITAELAKEVMFMAHLFTIDLISGTHRWTDISNSVYWGGYWYISQGISFEQATSTLKSRADSVLLNIQNVDKGFSNLMMTEDIKGRPVAIQRVFLDNNLAVIGSPVTLFIGYIDPVEADRSRANVEVANHMVKWRIITPKRQHSITCPWTFKTTECAFNGDVIRNPISDIVAEFTRNMGSLNYKNVDDYLTDLTMGATFTGIGADACVGGTPASDSYEGAHSADKAFDDDTGTAWTSADACSGGTPAADSSMFDATPDKAFDDDPATAWLSGTLGFPHWISYQFAAPIAIKEYSILPSSANLGKAPKDFKFQRSNNGVDWVDLDTQTGITDWAAGVTKHFTFTNSTSYPYYRVYITATVESSSDVMMVEIGMFSGSPHWISYHLAASLAACEYSILPAGGNLGAAPKDFKFQGSVNGVDWVDLDTQTGITDWIAGKRRYFPIANTTSYDYYRLYITANGQASTVEIEIFSPDSADAAFDDDDGTHYTSGSTLPHAIVCQFATAKKIIRYTLTPYAQATAPNNFILQGANDGATWTEIDAREGVSWPATPTKRNFDVKLPGSYFYYRLYIFSNYGGAGTSEIKEMELIGDEAQVNDVDYNYTNNTAAKADLFGFSPISLAADATIATVTVRVRAKQVTAAARNIAGSIRIGGIDYDATAIAPATAFTDYDFVWPTNPYTGVAWVQSDFFLTDDLCVGGTPTADSYYGASTPTQAFDNNPSTGWSSAVSALPHWIQYRLLIAQIVKRYTMVGYGTPSYTPTAWTLKGSDNGVDWTTLDTRSGVSWGASEKKEFYFANTTAYLYYRINITAGGVSGEVIINEIELFTNIPIGGFGYSTPADAGGHEVDVSECRIKISSDAQWCDFTPDRCEALNNRLNYGGFKYMSELAIKEYWWGAKQKVWTGAN